LKVVAPCAFSCAAYSNTKAKNVFINRIAAYSDEWSQTSYR
jgi:hypothetical protein